MDNGTGEILVLVEGARTDVRLMEHLLKIYGIDHRHRLVSYNTNIYALYNSMFRMPIPAAWIYCCILNPGSLTNKESDF